MARNTNPVGIREILIVNAGGDISPQVQAGLREKRYATRLVAGVQNIKAALKVFSEPILLFEAGPNPKSLEQCVKDISKLATEVRLPVILVGDGADSYERTLDELFPAATTLNIPYGAAEILAAVNYVSRTYLERKRQAESSAQEAPAQSSPQDSSRSSPDELHSLYTNAVSIPSLVFGQLDTLDLAERKLGGGSFSTPDLNEDFLIEQGMFPVDLKVQEAVRGLCVDTGKWGRSHLVRTSYMSQKIVEAMNPDKELQENLKAAGFLYASSCIDSDAALLRRPYLHADEHELRAELSKKIKESALHATIGLKLEQTGKIIETLARLIGKEAQIGDDDISITASAIMAADVTSRICYPTGPWNPRRAYILLSQLRKREIQELHPAVLCCTVKFIAEAVSARTPLFLIKKELRRNKQFLEAVKAEARAPLGIDEKKIPLSALVPGMQLSKPLKSIDGREILATDLVLDEDLIWRLWQLSAIRPLNAPIVINKQI